MKLSWRGARLRHVAAAIVVAGSFGCAGSGGGTSGHSMAIVGAVDSPFLAPLKARFGVNDLTGGVGDPEKADLLVLDGDTISPTHLASGGIIDRALKQGRRVLIVDVKEAHQKALSDLGHLGAYNPGESHAVLYSPYSIGNGKTGLHTLVVRKRDKTFHKHTGKIKNGSVVVGQSTTTTEAQDVTKGLTDKFAQRVGELMDDPWVDPIAGTVPSAVIWSSSSVEQFDYGQVTNLDGQDVLEDVTYIYRVFLNNAGNDPSQYRHLMLVEADGWFTTGELAHDNEVNISDGIVTQEIGWAQVLGSISSQVDRTQGNGSGYLLNTGVSPMQAYDGGWQTDLDYTIVYKDANGNNATWDTGIQIGPNQVDNFTAAITQGPDPIATFYQTWPFNALAGDYQNERDANTGELAGFPDAAVGNLQVSTGSAFLSTALVPDRVIVNHATARQYMDFVLTTAEPSGIYIDLNWNTAIQPGNERAIVDFRKAQPSTTTPGGRK